MSYGKEWQVLTNESKGIRMELLPDAENNFIYPDVTDVKSFRGKVRDAKNILQKSVLKTLKLKF